MKKVLFSYSEGGYIVGRSPTQKYHIVKNIRIVNYTGIKYFCRYHSFRGDCLCRVMVPSPKIVINLSWTFKSFTVRRTYRFSGQRNSLVQTERHPVSLNQDSNNDYCHFLIEFQHSIIVSIVYICPNLVIFGTLL